jgi:hypothetical protein
LNKSCRSRRSTKNEIQIQELLNNISRKSTGILSLSGNSFDSTISTFRKSKISAASVRDSDYHQSLRYRTIYIKRDDSPVELIQRATRIISRLRASSEINDTITQKLRDKSRRLRNEAEDIIIKQLTPHIIPAIDEMPNQRLEINSDQM